MERQGYWERIREQRGSRRRLLWEASAGGVALALITTAGCGGAKKPAGAASGSAAKPASKQPKRGGTLTHTASQESNGDTLDPQTSTPLKGEGLRLVYQGLLDYDPVSFDLQPEIGQKWEQPSQTEYTFKLQPGVKWQRKPPANGRALTADDVVYSLERARSPDPNFTSRSLLDTVDKIQAVDSSTVRMTAKGPDAALLSKLSADSLLMVAREVVDKAGKFASADTVVGTGAFTMTTDEEMVGADFVRNPEYWKPGLPYLDAFRTKFFNAPGDQGAWAAFLSGQLSATVAPGGEVKKYIGQQGPGYSPLWFRDTTEWMLTPNTKMKPFDDARVTKALRLLCDHEAFKSAWAESSFGRGQDGAFLPASLGAWDFSEDEYKTTFLEWKQPKDEAVKEALALLGAAGFSASKPLKFQLAATNNYPTVAPLLQSHWRQFGKGAIETDIKIYETAIYQQVRAKRDFTYGAFSNSASFSEVDVNLTQLYTSGSSRNYWNYGDPELDAMVAKQRTIFDDPQRKAAVRQILLYLMDHWPGSIMTQRLFFNATQPNVRNFSPEFWLHGAQYERVWLAT